MKELFQPHFLLMFWMPVLAFIWYWLRTGFWSMLIGLYREADEAFGTVEAIFSMPPDFSERERQDRDNQRYKQYERARIKIRDAARSKLTGPKLA